MKEKGSASLKINLDDSAISVYHGSDNVILLNGVVKKGAWNRIFKAIEKELK